ncbi:replication initiation protein [Acinetobacter sp. B5B]|jgi:plasmid replication initiation protein|uniref:replication initiation protein RepM n=1 Tax=Acinetobacter baretiae TaxID=2605383 RepID=UPI0018C21B9B|nr:replication initiation protein RepM [Acinetobacter baretiae]MBF7684088.1 replication initiation protein [Acinetobacter baretiae]
MSDLIVKSNRLVQAIQTLSLAETRLLQLAVIDARETGKGLSTDEPLELSAIRYAKAFNVIPDTAYLALIEAEESLFKRQFTIINEDGSTTKSRWIQDANYRKGEGRILVTLTRVVIDHVTKIDGFEQYFTSYHLQKTANFKSVYAIRLYELLMQWKSVGKTPVFYLENFREQLGISENEYVRMEAFKRRVLDIALDQVNEFSDINVQYEQHKKGRTIAGFSFRFKVKEKIEISKEKLVNKTKCLELTDAQINMFGNQLAKLPDLAYLAVGNESYEALASRIKDMLRDPLKQMQFLPHLKKLGFSR